MIEVIVSKHFPYESTDPKRPGTVHGAMVLGKFYCSRALADKLRCVSLDGKGRLTGMLLAGLNGL